MLPKTNRLTSQADFSETKNKGKVLQSSSFGMVFQKRNDSEPSRFGFIVSNKVSKKATERNKIKRLLREAVSVFLKDTKSGRNVLFLAKGALVGRKFDKLLEEVRQSLGSAGIFKKDG